MFGKFEMSIFFRKVQDTGSSIQKAFIHQGGKFTPKNFGGAQAVMVDIAPSI